MIAAAGIALTWLAVVGCLKAAYQPLWFDEIISILIAKQPTFERMCAVAKSGADGQPPAYDWLIGQTVRLTGSDAFGLRLPSICGFLTFCAALFFIVRRSASGAYGLIALLVPCVAGSWYYATEGRPYGLMLGCAGWAVWCWQSIATDEKRRYGLIGLPLALAAAVSIHFFAPLIVVALLMAEAIRTARRRRADLPVLAGLVLPLLVLAPYLPVIRASKINSGDPSFWMGRPAWFHSLLETSDQMLTGLWVPLLLIGVFYLVARIRFVTEEPGVAPWRLWVEATLTGTLLLIPLMGVALSKFVTHLFFPRYVIVGIAGVAIGLSIALYLAFSGRRAPALAAAGILVFLLLQKNVYEIRNAISERSHPSKRNLETEIPKPVLQDSLPIVIGNSFSFLELRYYADPKFLPRFHYLASEKAAKRYIGFTLGERIMLGSAPYFGTQVDDYAQFVRSHREFYVFGLPEWLGALLLEDGAQMTMLNFIPGRDGASPGFLFRVRFP